ncbi:MAG: enolase C-terminal domain-like protein [Balneolaceae bacterium]|nr:enolase C-terminal domain-like protein [Balneolaceae bacterium]
MGRPYKWVKGEAGVKRDIEAFKAVREAVGYNFNIMADANDGYEQNFDWAVRMLRECAPYEMYWMEEIFPETTKIYRRLHTVLNQSNVKIPIAEGEDVRDVDQFQSYLEEELFNFIQPDMRTVGFSNILRGAKMAGEHGVSLIPHNWASEIGKLMSILCAVIQKNITFAEDDRYHTLAIDASGYLFRDGQWTAPDRPGWGIRLNDHYDYFQRNNEEAVIS